MKPLAAGIGDTVGVYDDSGKLVESFDIGYGGGSLVLWPKGKGSLRLLSNDLPAQGRKKLAIRIGRQIIK